MKTKIILPLLAAIAFFLTACGGNYARTQSDIQRNGPIDCGGLHTKQGQWHFTDENGLVLDVTGVCAKGQKHGEFDYYANGKLIAKTKYSHDEELKTACLAKGKSKIPNKQCLALAAQNN